MNAFGQVVLAHSTPPPLTRSRPMHPEDKKWWTIVAIAVAAFIVFVLANGDPLKDYAKMKNDYEMSRLRDAHDRGR